MSRFNLFVGVKAKRCLAISCDVSFGVGYSEVRKGFNTTFTTTNTVQYN